MQQLKALAEGQHALAEGQQALRQDVSALQQGQQRIETRLENEVIDKIRALFDDRSMNQDYFTSIRDSLARVEDRVGFLVR